MVPVGTGQVGWVVPETVGTEGDEGVALITAFEDAFDVQPDALVTMKVYVEDALSPLKV